MGAPALDAAAVTPETAAAILSLLRSRQSAMADRLRQLAEIESPTIDRAACGRMLDAVSSDLERLGFRCRLSRGHQTAGFLRAIPPDGPPGPFQLLVGHVDTVWPIGTLASMPVRLDKGQLFGPGTYDMKAGIVQGLYAIEAIQELGLRPPVRPVWLIASDEEVGSPESAGYFGRFARRADRALVLEPSLGPTGKLKTARKGVGRFTLEVQGKSAHAGLDPDRGVSAILALAYATIDLFALNDPDAGTTVNVGVVRGGQQPNVIAPLAHAEIDVRVRSRAEARRIEQVLRALRPRVTDARFSVVGSITRPPMERTPRNRALWRQAHDFAQTLGIGLDEATVGGGSDGNWCSQHTATLDGLGAVGGGAHAPDEHVQIDRMPERAALLACLLLSPPSAPTPP